MSLSLKGEIEGQILAFELKELLPEAEAQARAKDWAHSLQEIPGIKILGVCSSRQGLVFNTKQEKWPRVDWRRGGNWSYW